MHMHTIQLSTMQCVCIISTLFIFEKILIFINELSTQLIYCMFMCLFELSHTLVYCSIFLYGSRVLFSTILVFASSPCLTVSPSDLFVHFLPAFPISSGFGRCVCVSHVVCVRLCVSSVHLCCV